MIVSEINCKTQLNPSFAWYIVGEVLLAAVVLGCFAREFREEAALLLIVVMFSAFCGFGLTITANQAFCFEEPEISTAQVEQLKKSDDDYDCVIVDELGQEHELDISESLYDRLEIGEIVEYQVYPGALGYPYCKIVPIE